MIIREIQPNDNQDIARIIRQVLIEHNVPKVGTAYADPQLDFMFETYNLAKSIYFVVEIDGKILGGAGISALEKSTENICELQKMYFLKEARGKGIGYEIMQKCIQKAEEFQYEKCYLETMPYMLDAQKLYKKVGFKYLEKPLGSTGHTNCPVWMIRN